MRENTEILFSKFTILQSSIENKCTQKDKVKSDMYSDCHEIVTLIGFLK